MTQALSVKHSIVSNSVSYQDKPNIIVGGGAYGMNATKFYQVVSGGGSLTNRITFKSFETDMMKPNANLTKIGYSKNTGAKDTHSFLTKDQKHIIVLSYCNGYNVYDKENDKWLETTNSINWKFTFSQFARSLLINDEIIVISEGRNLLFFSIAKRYNHFLNPQLIAKYQIQTPNVEYKGHGMCCIGMDVIHNASNSKKQCFNYNIKIVLFGSFYGVKFLESFLLLNISINANYYTFLNGINSSCITCSENKIDFGIDNHIEYNDGKWINMDPNDKSLESLAAFGFECVYNSKQEPIIIIVGGYCWKFKNLHKEWLQKYGIQIDKSVIACNINTRRIQRSTNVRCLPAFVF